MSLYLYNTPVMYSDSTGYAPEWWHWAASGAMVVAGIALMFTPLGILGGALLTAGVSSMVGGYISERSGGSFTAGWVGGAVAGFVLKITDLYANDSAVEVKNFYHQQLKLGYDTLEATKLTIKRYYDCFFDKEEGIYGLLVNRRSEIESYSNHRNR